MHRRWVGALGLVWVAACAHAVGEDTTPDGGKIHTSSPDAAVSKDSGADADAKATTQCTVECTTADAGDLAPGTGNPDPGVFDGGYDGGPGWSVGTADCSGSTCDIQCPTAMTLCSDRICYDVENHHDHCGACSTACADGTEWCTQGHCCSVGQQYCSSGCADLSNDAQNCGACGNACANGKTCNGGVCSACVPITGPSLPNAISGWPTSGLRIKALATTTLSSFTFHNQGQADTVELTTTSGTVLESISVPASTTTFVANVSWPLTAGTSYELVSLSGTNGYWDSYSTYPTTGGSLEIDGMVDSSHSVQTIYWFDFTDLETCP